MASLKLEGENLGDKHRNYNKKLQDYIVNHKTLPDHTQGDDVNNLLKIDIASHNKDVEYILNALKSDDMLYVSRALARCKWLVTDQNYANIINPDYLKSELFPNMTMKAIIKFKKHIRHNINDETRAENFYLNESNKADAVKWLPHCSVEFIEKNIVNYDLDSIKIRLFKRICERSISIFEITFKNRQYTRWDKVKAVTFLLNTDVDKFLDILEKCKVDCPKLSHKSTELIMKHSSKRVMDNLEKYIPVVHKPTFVRYLNVDEIKSLLQTEAKQNRFFLFQYDTLKHFIHRLPKDEQFQFAKKVCMNEESDKDNMVAKISEINNYQSYFWYQFAPFEVAFKEITNLISQNEDSLQRDELFSLLIQCAKHNLQNIQDILKYYVNKHKNENSSKLRFVDEIITHLNVSKYDETTWNILNELLAAMQVHDGTTNYGLYTRNTSIVNSIIIYNALNDQKTPDEIEKQFVFNTLKSHKAKLNPEQRNKICNSLYDRLTSKLNDPITDKNYMQEVSMIETIIKLLRDWDKSLLDYPLVLDRIRQMIKLKKENSWTESLSSLYNTNKAWRKHMFEESLALSPNEEVCLNALKHDPELFSRSNEEMAALKTNDSVSLQRLQSKLRIYWPHSIGQQWIDEYLNKMNESNENGQKATILGICKMLPQKPLLDIIEKYKPDKAKIDWKHIDERVLNIQRLLAKNMHRGRPQPTPDAILSYAKGDYLQFALPSLLAILYNLKTPIAKQYILKLLDTPVSLQKHGIRFAFKRLDHDELKKIFLNCWKTSKNATIRAIIFNFTHTLLCDEKDANATGLWELLEIFIDNLTFTEDKEIYKIFSNVEKVPINVRANYIVKSYHFLQKLIPNILECDRPQCQDIVNRLKAHSREVMETISSDFVTSIIQEYIDTTFLTQPRVQHSDNLIQVISAYLLCCKTENEQIKKYESDFIPIMRRSFEKWDEKKDIFFVRRNFDQLLTRFNHDLKDYVVKNEMVIPIKMFTLIMTELDKTLSATENYMILTKWKLTVALAKLAQEYPSAENDETIGLEFGKICLQYLKADVAAHFPCIYILFSKCVEIYDLSVNAKIKFFNSLLSDKDFVQAYLSSIELGIRGAYNWDYQNSPWVQLSSHPSLEVKMHYSNRVNKVNRIIN